MITRNPSGLRPLVALLGLGGQNFIDQRNQMLDFAGGNWRYLPAAHFFRRPSADIFKRWP